MAVPVTRRGCWSFSGRAGPPDLHPDTGRARRRSRSG